MKIQSPYKVVEVKFQRNYPGYIYRRELVDDSEYGGDGKLEMVNCYLADSGLWIGNAKDARFLCIKMGLSNIQKRKPSHSSCSIGFNKTEQKWYGWSHRAIYGFGIGSTCKKVDCCYRPVDEKDAIEDGLRFWSEDNHLDIEASEPVTHEGRRGVWISWKYPNSKKIKNKKIRGTISSVFWDFPDEYGKGEWTADTMEAAKQMASYFAEGVS